MLLALLGGARNSLTYTTMAALEAVAAITCEPGSRNSDPILLHSLLSEAAALGRPLFQLFSHPAGTSLHLTTLLVTTAFSSLAAESQTP